MRTRQTIAYGFCAAIAIITLAFAALLLAGCDSGNSPGHKHKWGEWIETTAPTCTTAGVEMRVCEIDPMHTATRPIAKDPNAHGWGNWNVTTAPTQTIDGEETRECRYNAAHTEARIVSALNHEHVWGAWVTTTPATETKDGEETRTCTLNPLHTETRIIIALGLLGESPRNPLPLVKNIYLGTGWYTLLTEIATEGKYVALDLSACTMSHTEFDPARSMATGKNKIVSIILPDDAYSVMAGSSSYGAFDYFTELTTVKGKNITSIGKYAFYGRTSLTSVSFPKVTDIGEGAFSKTGFTTMDGNASFPLVTSLSEKIFSGCESLESVSFPAVTAIGNNAFSSCTNLKTVSFPELESLPNYNFSYNINTVPFYGCTALANVSMPKLETIGNNAFYGCTGLTSVSFPAATSIGNYAFYDCTKIASITIPASVTTVGGGAFANWTNQQTINVPFANAGVRPSGWNSTWNGGSAVIRYWNGSSYQ